MPNYADLSFEQKVGFLLDWARDCAEFERPMFEKALSQVRKLKFLLNVSTKTY